MRPVDTACLALVLALLATMPAFALKSRQRTVDAEVAKRPTTAILGFFIRDWFMWVLGPIERPLIRARITPDSLNYLGVAFGIGAGVAFAVDRLPLAGGFIALTGIVDILDGRIARALGVDNIRGAFLDSTLDRFAEAFAFVGVGWYLSSTPWTVAASMLAMGGSLLVSYARARGEALGVEMKGGLMQRAERLLLLTLAAMFDGAVAHAAGWRPGLLLAITVTLIGVGSVATAVYRTFTIASTLRQRGKA